MSHKDGYSAHHCFTHDCSLSCPGNHIIKFADDATVLGLISNKKKCEELAAWCSSHNLALNIKKTREMILDFSRSVFSIHSPLHINIEAVERIFSFIFLGLTVSDDLSWNNSLSSEKLNSSTKLATDASGEFRPLHHRERTDLLRVSVVQQVQALQKVTKLTIIGSPRQDISTVTTSCCLHPTHNIIRSVKGLSRRTRMKNLFFSPPSCSQAAKQSSTVLFSSLS